MDIANNVATWRDQAGNIIASIDLDNEGNENVAFRYDEATRTSRSVTTRQRGCSLPRRRTTVVSWQPHRPSTSPRES
ncbi:hypothetical protein [Corynebacterium diphtheriae]|uniref:hypothetical protein n=1 Tax=Corynebacterium diphtheriae TaxID=1717 RepID=UPI002119DB34|nr:hypothetical protein [Corynebacterium diphtheriae]